MSYETILVEQRGAVTLVTLNRPQALNALNSQVLAELIDAFAAFDADPGQGCAVLTGSERAFAPRTRANRSAERASAEGRALARLKPPQRLLVQHALRARQGTSCGRPT